MPSPRIIPIEPAYLRPDDRIAQIRRLGPNPVQDFTPPRRVLDVVEDYHRDDLVVTLAGAGPSDTHTNIRVSFEDVVLIEEAVVLSDEDYDREYEELP